MGISRVRVHWNVSDFTQTDIVDLVRKEEGRKVRRCFSFTADLTDSLFVATTDRRINTQHSSFVASSPPNPK